MSDGGHWLRCVRNAWQGLGNLSPEMAMEQYITILSEKVPGWMEDHFAVSLLLLSDLYMEDYFCQSTIYFIFCLGFSGRG